MPAFIELNETYELIHHGSGWYRVEAVPALPIPPLPGEGPGEAEIVPAAIKGERRTVGWIGARVDNTFGVGHGASGETPLGRVVAPEEGRQLLEDYSRARGFLDWAESCGRNDTVHLAIRTIFGDRP